MASVDPLQRARELLSRQGITPKGKSWDSISNEREKKVHSFNSFENGRVERSVRLSNLKRNTNSPKQKPQNLTRNRSASPTHNRQLHSPTRYSHTHEPRPTFAATLSPSRSRSHYQPSIETPTPTVTARLSSQSETVHERLYNLSREIDEKRKKIESEDGKIDPKTGKPYFKPVINPSSRSFMSNCDPDYLYNEALLRKERQQSREEANQTVIPSAPRVSPINAVLTRRKIERLVREVFAELDPEGSGVIANDDLVSAFGILGLFKVDNTQGTEKSTSSVKSVGHRSNTALNAEKQEQRELAEETWQVLDTEGKGNITFESFSNLVVCVLDKQVEIDNVQPVELRALVRKLRKFRKNTLVYGVVNKVAKPFVEDVEAVECTFRPELDPQSRKMEAQKSNDEARFERLHNLAKEQKEKKEQIGKIREKIDLQGCTFRPQVNEWEFGERDNIHQRLYEQYHEYSLIRDSELQKTTEDAEFEKHCTFKPDTTLSQMTFRQIPKELSLAPNQSMGIPGDDTHVQRIRKAHEEKKLLEMRKNMEDRFTAETYAASRRNREPKPFSFQMRNDSILKRPPLLYMDVNLGKGKTGRIGIHEGDHPNALASSFCMTYQLDQDLCEQLEGMIREQMQKHQITIAGEGYSSLLESLDLHSLNHNSKSEKKGYASAAENRNAKGKNGKKPHTQH